MEFLKIKETCLYVRDLKGARKFYHDTLGLSVIAEEDGKHLFLRAGSSVLLCFNPEDSRKKVSPPPHYGEGKQHFAFEVVNSRYEEAKAFILSKGVAITQEMEWKPGVKSFYFEDPEGNVLEILPDAGVWD